MKKLFKKYPAFSGALLCLVFVAMVAAIPTNIVRTFHLWVGSVTATPGNVTMGDGVAYIESDVEIDGTLYADGGISTSTGTISATEIADVTREIDIPLSGFMISPIGTGYYLLVGNDGASTPQTSPGITLVDAIPKLVWASGEQGASIMYSFIVPGTYTSSLSFRLAASTDTDTAATSWGFDWGLFVNNSATAFDAASYVQDFVACAEGSPSTKNAFFTLTADATAAADVAAGDIVTVVIFPYDVRVGPGAGGTTELISIQARYTATQ